MSEPEREGPTVREEIEVLRVCVEALASLKDPEAIRRCLSYLAQMFSTKGGA